MVGRGFAMTLVALAAVVGMAVPRAAVAADSTDASTLREIRREIKKLEQDRTRDLDEIQKLEGKVEQLENENTTLKSQNKQIQDQQTATTQTVKEIQSQAEEGPTTRQFSDIFSRYLGSHTFLVTGAAGIAYQFDQQSGALAGIPHASQNTWLADWEPMILYRPADWILFEGVISTNFGAHGTGVDLSDGDFQLFLNDYVELVGGLFDQPFGDWYEAQSPMWVNRFITAPLPNGVEPVVPPSEMGLQVRGGFQWGQLGQDFDYVVWTGDGIGYSAPVFGAASTSPQPVASAQTNGKSIGARLRIYPLPLDANLGRLELGASTYNGKWFAGEWYNAWGVDFNYFIGNLQTRGEWEQAYRQLPGVTFNDDRQGWYIQAGYFLNGINVPGLPDQLNRYFQRLEPLIRYSGVNQHAVALGDIAASTVDGTLQTGLVPDFGLNGSPATFAPHSREVAIGLDYWIEPSIVWQNELDIELPRAGGLFIAPDGTATPAGSIPNDRAFLSQFTVGF